MGPSGCAVGEASLSSDLFIVSQAERVRGSFFRSSRVGGAPLRSYANGMPSEDTAFHLAQGCTVAALESPEAASSGPRARAELNADQGDSASGMGNMPVELYSTSVPLRLPRTTLTLRFSPACKEASGFPSGGE